MEINALLEQIKKLEEAVKNLNDANNMNTQKLQEAEDNFVDDDPMMVTGNNLSPSSNMEYRSRLRKLRSAYRKELKDLKNEYGVAPRHRANFTKVKKG